jgi:tripartite-type tricarboxylate transporter receptor subunit TctC
MPMLDRCRFLRSITVACLPFLLGPSANAQTLKTGTLSLVVPFAAGGPSDVAGRILA